jgi:hypothetical protein
MPRDLAMAVKNYMLDAANAQGYREAMSRTGPLNNSVAYHKTSSSEAAFYVVDDPYWQEFMAKNSKAADVWRTPSMLAWDHKPYGLLGEVCDVQKL